MKLWLLRPIDSESGPWDPWYNKAFGHVIQAASEERARQLADLKGGVETWGDRRPWLDSELTTCDELVPSGEEGVIMTDFHDA